MASSSSSSALTLQPIVFLTSGKEPDMRLHVLDKAVFHVHSETMKLQSDYFLKGLNSSNKPDAEPVAGGFRYEWITKVEEDGSWSLIEAEDENIGSQGMENFKSSAAEHTEAFTDLLHAIYGRPYVVKTDIELTLLNKLADDYSALAALSRTLSAALREWEDKDVAENANALAPVPLKLRRQEVPEESIISGASQREDSSSSRHGGLEGLEGLEYQGR